MAEESRPLRDRPIDANRRIKVVCLGAGYSGILTAIRFPQQIPNLDLVIYEKNADIGGTWFENRLACCTTLTYSSPPTNVSFRYPGVACGMFTRGTAFVSSDMAYWMTDIPSHVYQFTFASNPDWANFYASGAEIQEYLKDVAWKYDVEKYVRLRHYFQKAEWDEKEQQWRLTVTNLNTNQVC